MPVRVWLIEVPEPAEAPLTVPLVVTTVHEKVAPVGADVKAIFGEVPLQIVAEAGVAVATGKAVTFNNAKPFDVIVFEQELVSATLYVYPFIADVIELILRFAVLDPE